MNRVGHRFDPKPEELADLLEKKNRDPAFTVPDIKDDHIYKHHPSELLGWFFCKLEKKYDKSDTLISRTAIGGSWKKTGEDRLVEATDSNKPILIKKIFVFYKDCVFIKENKTNWVMHEYSEIHEDHNSNKQGQVVLCFIKRNPDNKRKPSRIERKPGKKRKTSSSLEEGQPSDSGYNVAQDISEVEPRLQPNQNIPYVTNISPEVQPSVPALQDEPIDCDRVCHKSLSTFQSPIYQTPGSFASSGFSNDSAHWLVQNSFSVQQSPILLPPESSYSGSFSKDATNGLNHSSLSALQWPIHPQPGSSHSSGFSNDATNHSSFSALQWPTHPQPGSSHSSGFSNGSNVWTPRFASEQQDDVANSQPIEVESLLQLNQHMSPIIGDHVANAILSQIQPQLESQLLPNQHTSPIIGDANAILSQLEYQLLPNRHFEDYGANSLFSEIESQLLPNCHLSSNIENHAAKDIFSRVRPLVPPQRNELIDCNGLCHKTFSTLQSPIYPTLGSFCSAMQSPIHLLPESLYSGNFSNNLTNGLELDHNSVSALPVLTYPQPESSYSSGFSNYSTSGLDHNSYSAPPVPIYPQPESSYSSGFSNYSTGGLDHNSFSAPPVLIYPLSESSYSSGFSNYSTSGLHHNSFSASLVPIYPLPESSFSSRFSNYSTSGLDHNSLSGLQFPIHPLPESSYSSGFSNDVTNGLNHNSFSALQPINPQPGSHSSGISNGSDVWNPQFAVEQEDDLANSHWSVQDDFSSPETGHTFPPDFNPSKAVAGG